MMYQCGRCGLTRASSQEPMGLAIPQCKCPFEFLPPISSAAPQRTWVGLTLDERLELAQDVDWAAGAYCEYAEKIEAKLKEKNTK